MNYKKALFLTLLLFVSINVFCQTKKVFAHYMLGIGTYQNNSVEGFKQDVREAIKYGVDGFALNFGAWEPRYQQNMKNMVQAIDEIDSNFVFFFSIDKSTDMPDSITINLVKQYYNNKKYFRYQDKFFLSAWGGKETASQWQSDVLLPLKHLGYQIYFVPFFFPNGNENPSYDNYVDNIKSGWKNILNGYFYFGVAGIPFYSSKWPSILSTGEAAAKAFHSNGLTFMGCITPQYWQSKPKNGRRYYDYAGGEGLGTQWASLINIQKADWVEMVTWNDWDESTYFSPMENIENYTKHIRHSVKGFYKSHAGYAALNKYYIDWYKAGKQPEIQKDRIFYFYRTHAMDAVAANDEFGNILKKVGDIKDIIYITVFIKDPADLVVNTGNKEYVYHLKQGVSNIEIPFKTGKQLFKLVNNGKTIVYAQGEDIAEDINLYNFIYYSGATE